MDFFNIGTRYRNMADMLTQMMRQTGRTTLLVDTLRDGDMVVCTDHRQARTLTQLCLERGVNIQTQVADPKSPATRLRGLRSNRKTFLDHVFVEEYYRVAIERAGKELDEIERRLSRPDETSNKVVERKTTPFDMYPGSRFIQF